MRLAFFYETTSIPKIRKNEGMETIYEKYFLGISNNKVTLDRRTTQSTQKKKEMILSLLKPFGCLWNHYCTHNSSLFQLLQMHLRHPHQGTLHETRQIPFNAYDQVRYV